METYRYKTMLCPRCNVQNLIQVTAHPECPSCGFHIITKSKKRRNFSERKPRIPLHEPKTKKLQEEEKKSPVKPAHKPRLVKRPIKQPKAVSNPKCKEVQKKSKKPITNRHSPKKNKALPAPRPRQDYNSDSSDYFDEAFYTDSLEEFTSNFPAFGFDPIHLRPHDFFESVFDRPTVNRISHNLFNLFFDSSPGFSEIHFAPLPTSRNESSTYMISEILNRLINMHPDQASPADPQVVERIPLILMTESLIRDQPKCAICQEDFQVNEVLKKLRCSHFYHEQCILPWLQAKDNCPVCRETVY